MRRILALTAGTCHNDHAGQPVPRSLTAFDHRPLGIDHLVTEAAADDWFNARLVR
jgi:hypothetical protein